MIFIGTLLFFTRGNEFPYFYHPDEPRKAEQVMKGRRNMNHPLLLLTTTTVVSKLVPGQHTQQKVAVLGRWVSAGFSAGAVTALALTGLYLYGWMGMAAVATILSFNSQLFDLSHFMKEDTALVFGISCFILAITVYWRERSKGSIIFLGISSALALSGKYIGVLFPLAAAKIILDANRNSLTKKEFCSSFWIAFGVTLALVNYQIFYLLPKMIASIGNESRYIVSGNDGIARQIPHSRILTSFFQTSFPLLVLFCLYLGWLVTTRRQRRLDEWMLVSIPFAFGLILSFTPTTAGRYYLPISVLISFIGAISLAGTATFLERRRRMSGLILLLLGLAIVLPQEMKGIRSTWALYMNPQDTRMEMLATAKTLPKSSVIVTDKYVRLKELNEEFLDEPLPFKILSAAYAADVDSMGELGQKVDYVMVCGKTFDRLFDTDKFPRNEEAMETLKRRKEFYEHLFEKGKLIWQSEPRKQHSYGDVELRIYQVNNEAAEEESPALEDSSEA